MSNHQAYVPESFEVEDHVHEQNTWNPADWNPTQIALVAFGGLIVIVTVLLFVKGCKHANCRKPKTEDDDKQHMDTSIHQMAHMNGSSKMGDMEDSSRP